MEIYSKKYNIQDKTHFYLSTKNEHSAALENIDEDTLLNEGQTELTQLRQDLKDNMALYYPID